MIGAGKFDRRVQMQLGTRAQDALGQVNLTYGSAFGVWAMVKFNNGSFDVVQAKDTKVNKAEFIIRYIETVNKDTRITFNNSTYSIEDIQPIERNRFLKLICEERT